MLFTYKAKSNTGEIIEATIESPDKLTLSRELRAKGLIPVSVIEKKVSNLSLDFFIGKIFGKVKVSELIIFTRNLSGMLKAGLALSRALSVILKQTRNNKFKEVITDIINQIDTGTTFATALSKHPKVFSKLFVSMVQAGEESGNLASALNEIGMNLSKSHALTKKIKGAMTYPSVILGAMVIIGILLFAYVVPTLSATFVEIGVELPATTKFIIALGNFFSEYLILALLGAVSLIFGIIYLFKSAFMAKYIDFVILKLPVIGTMAREVNTSRVARTMSSLLIAGVNITRAIEITENVVQNTFYKKTLVLAREKIEKGAPFSAIFVEYSNLYPVMMSEMIEVGEETGKLSDMLLEVAIFYEEEIENKTKDLSTIIEPILMVFIGGGVGFFAVSMITPLYSVLNNI